MVNEGIVIAKERSLDSIVLVNGDPGIERKKIIAWPIASEDFLYDQNIGTSGDVVFLNTGICAVESSELIRENMWDGKITYDQMAPGFGISAKMY